MVAAVGGHHVPYAGLNVVFVKVLLRGVERRPGGDRVHEPVVGFPALVHVIAARGVAGEAAHFARRNGEHRFHVRGIRHLVAVLILVRKAGRYRKIVYARQRLERIRQLQGVVDRHIVGGAVFVNAAVHRRGGGGIEEGGGHAHVRKLIFFVLHFIGGGAVDGRRKRGYAVEPVALAAGEQSGNIAFIRYGAFRFAAFVHQPYQHQHGGAAEGMAQNIDLILSAPAADQRSAGIIRAVARVMAALRVLFAVVGFRAGELGVELAGAVPCAGGGGYARPVRVNAAGAQIGHQVAAEHAPVGKRLVIDIVFAPAGKPVHENVGVIGGHGFFIKVVLGNIEPREQEHQYRHQKRYDLLHGSPP